MDVKTAHKPIEAIFFRDFKNSYLPDILDEIYTKAIYKPFLAGRQDLVIADLGANRGLFTYYARDYAKRIYAVEPTADHLEILNKMLEFNKITNVTVCPVAISNKTEKRKFYLNENSTANSLSVTATPENFEEVQVLSFDDFWTQYKLTQIDLLKLDVEGEEGIVITSPGFAKHAPNIKVIVGEWHSWCNMNQNQFANTLLDLGYYFRWLQGLKASVFTAVRI